MDKHDVQRRAVGRAWLIGGGLLAVAAVVAISYAARSRTVPHSSLYSAELSTDTAAIPTYSGPPVADQASNDSGYAITVRPMKGGATELDPMAGSLAEDAPSDIASVAGAGVNQFNSESESPSQR